MNEHEEIIQTLTSANIKLIIEVKKLKRELLIEKNLRLTFQDIAESWDKYADRMDLPNSSELFNIRVDELKLQGIFDEE